MKLLGNKRNGRHSTSRFAKKHNSEEEIKPKSKSKWKKRLAIIGSSIIAVFLVLTVVILIFWQREVRPPEIGLQLRPRQGSLAVGPSDSQTSEGNPNTGRGTGRPSSLNPGEDFYRDPDVYTFLLLGLDDWNTDVNMVVAFNAREYTMDVVNIPRDTMANVSWNIRKINSIYGAMRMRYPGEPEKVKEAMIDHFADVLGFEVNFVIIVDMRAFTRLVDAIDGVDFYVPMNMHYQDPYQNLSINIRRGQQRLSGQQALNLVRFRGYGDADIGRIRMQQEFLTAAAKQVLQDAGSINISELVTIFLRYVDTDLTYGELIWFARAMLRMDYENINFHMMPHRPDSVGGISYVSIALEEWLELVNEVLNPFSYQITPESETLSILTRGPDGRLFVTDDNWQGNRNWGQGTVRPPTAPTTTTTPPAATTPAVPRPPATPTPPATPPTTTPPSDTQTPPPADTTEPDETDDPYPSPYDEDPADIPPGDEPYPTDDNYAGSDTPSETPPDTTEPPQDESAQQDPPGEGTGD